MELPEQHTASGCCQSACPSMPPRPGVRREADDSPEASSDAAFAACEACMALLRAPRSTAADLDALVAYLPDTVIDRLLERKRSKL